MINDITEFLPIYTDIDNDNFYVDIFKKKEFFDERLEEIEEVKKSGDLLKAQTILSRFFSSYTPYNELLLVWQLGSGKCHAFDTDIILYNGTIKKVQNNCSLLTLYIKNKDNKKRQYVTGYLFDRVDTDINKKQKSKYTYNVYIPEYKMVSTFKTDELVENYSTMMFTLHLFMDEANLKQKIRLQKKE